MYRNLLSWVSAQLRVSAHSPFLMILLVRVYIYVIYVWLLSINAHPLFLAREYYFKRPWVLTRDNTVHVSQSTDTKVVYTALSAEALSRVSALGESLQARASGSSGHGSSRDGSGQTIKVVSLEQAGTVEKEPCGGDERDRTGGPGPGELNQPSIFPD